MSSKARKVETSQPVCAACGLVARHGTMGFLTKINSVVSDATGKQFPSDALFHAYHPIVIGPVIRERLQIPDDILEMTVYDRVEWEKDYESI